MFQATLVGRLGKDPETRATSKGTIIASVGVATEQGYGDNRTTEWVTCKVWGKSGSAFAEHARKGATMAFAGKVEIERWESKEGEKRSKVTLNVSEWSFVGPKGNGEDRKPARDNAGF